MSPVVLNAVFLQCLVHFPSPEVLAMELQPIQEKSFVQAFVHQTAEVI